MEEAMEVSVTDTFVVNVVFFRFYILRLSLQVFAKWLTDHGLKADFDK